MKLGANAGPPFPPGALVPPPPPAPPLMLTSGLFPPLGFPIGFQWDSQWNFLRDSLLSNWEILCWDFQCQEVMEGREIQATVLTVLDQDETRGILLHTDDENVTD